MALPTWGFADGHGNELARGWQGRADQARALAQRWANERKDVVEYWVEGSSTGDDEQPRPSYSCSPEP